MIIAWFSIIAALAQDLPCPGAMLGLESGSAWMGKARPKYGEDQVHPVEVHVEDFCIDALPFPGQVGDYWLEDGLEAGAVERFEGILAAFERRLCTAEELLWATASGPANLAFLTGRARPVHCEPNASWGDMKPLGAHVGCVNAWGVRDVNVSSAWVRASPEMDEARSASRQRDYVILGGTNRSDTFYAPTNFGLHAHDPGDIAYFDDQVRVCADPGAGMEAQWQLFREAAALQGSFEGAMRWFERHGLDAGALDVLEEPYLYIRDDG